ncbi:MAG TPA: hypothetical protein VMM58_04075 [Bacteroidota bacterium]|nr:hypothetical protein [Bacteroidota bacterium]
MQLHKFAATAGANIVKAAAGINRFAELERVLATFCISIPALLIWFDHGQILPSISAYYSMCEHEIFYFPLTVASMLFIVNGLIKNKHIYNTILGTMLAGVILFNCDDFTLVHALFAVAFFGGNGIVILVFSSKKDLWFKAVLVIVICMAILGWIAFQWYSLFWAEWVSFAIIALHYVLESAGVIDVQTKINGPTVTHQHQLE